MSETPRLASPLSKPIWKPKRKRNYPHFDEHLSGVAISQLVTSKDRVRKNAFFPFLVFKKSFNKFGDDKPRRERKKTRELRYAARKDAYIFEYYRHLLSEPYELELKRRGLSTAVVAYRKLRAPGGGGKCSIHFAKEVFEEIASHQRCIAISVDISKYFESLDHELIRKKWCGLLAVDRLPPDHFAVFKGITQYSQIARDEVYRRLGILCWDATNNRWKYKIKKSDVPTRLCTIDEFRDKIVKPDGGIWTNRKPYGIPQGAPISDLIANFYLLDFDERISTYLAALGGFYRRYCDDIVIIIPESDVDWTEVQKFLQMEIKNHGAMLQIKPEKSAVHIFDKDASGPCEVLHGGNKRFEYLGFQFNGHEVRFRDRTVSAFYRKVKWSMRYEARKLVRHYPKKSLPFISSKIDESDLLQKFGRVKSFSDCDDVRDWTFWTYVQRSSEIMGGLAPRIHSQVTNYKKFVRYHFPLELADAYARSLRAGSF